MPNRGEGGGSGPVQGEGSGGFMTWLQGLAGIGSVAAVFLLIFLPAASDLVLSVMDRYTGDWRTARLSPQARDTHPKVALVTITEETLVGYKTVSPIDRELLTRVVGAIDAGRPLAIGLDILFRRETEPEKDRALVEAIRSARSSVVLAAIDERGEIPQAQQAFQANYIASTGRRAGYVNLRYDKDQVVRNSAPPNPGGAFPSSFGRLLAAAAGFDTPDGARPISWLLAPPGKPLFLTIPAHKLLADPALARQLEGRIVLVGGDFPDRDRHRTPLAPDSDDDVSGLFIHAQMVAARLEPERAVRELGPSRERMLLMGLAIIGFFIGWKMWDSPLVNFLGWSFATAALIAADAAVFTQLHFLLPFTLATVSWFLGVTAGRFIRGFYEHAFAGRSDA